jgi:preprotein translocase subunit YajC
MAKSAGLTRLSVGSRHNLKPINPAARVRYTEFEVSCVRAVSGAKRPLMHNFAFLLAQTAANPALSFLPLIVIVAIFYFLVFMPMQRQKKQQAQMLANLEAGTEVLTTGGIVGTIVSISGDTLILRVKPDNIKLQVARSAVSGLIKQEAVTEKK